MLKLADLSLIVIIVGIIILIGACYYLWQQQSHLSREIKSLQYKLNGLSQLPASSFEQRQQQQCPVEVRSTSPIATGGGGLMEHMMKGMLQQIVDIPQMDESSEEESDSETTNTEIETDEESEIETEVESTKEDEQTFQQDESQESETPEITMMSLEDVKGIDTLETIEVVPNPIYTTEEVNVNVEEESTEVEQTCNELDTLRQIKDVGKIKKVLELKKRSDLQSLCEQLQIQFKPSGGYASKPELVSVLVKHLF